MVVAVRPPEPIPARSAPPAPPAPTPAVEVRDVKRQERGAVVLDGVTLTVARGELLFLVGPSGSGKSTLLRLLVKELEPTSGTLRVAGRELAALAPKRLPAYRRNVGAVFGDVGLLGDRTVAGNVALPLEATRWRGVDVRSRVGDVLRLTGLAERAECRPDELSDAERHRAAIARAIAGRPPLLLADEPTRDLDPPAAVAILKLLHRINRTGTTVLIATRDLELAERTRRRVIELQRGKVVIDVPAEEPVS